MRCSPRLLPALAFAWCAGLSAPLPAATTDDPQVGVPASLAPWVPWVLEDRDRRACALGPGAEGARICAWPGPLALELDAGGGRFAQSWQLAAEEWVPLPGGDGAWPQQVTSGDAPLAVVEHDGRPAVRLGPGTHRLSGAFAWPRRPELLALPPETGLVSLRLEGTAVASPRRDAEGRLWLGGGAPLPAPEAAPDTLSLEVMRRIEDGVPLQVRTRLALDVSGQARELTLGPVLLPGGIPLRLDSPLPARLQPAPGAGGVAWMLQVQLRPGRWTLTLDSHHPRPVQALALDARDAPWPPREVWVFAARPELRQVEPGGADVIDPRQTRLPADWQQLPAYLLHPGETLTLTELRRGMPGTDRLRLERDLRLDQSGDAFSVRDRLRGQLERQSRLDAAPALALGQVQVDGEPRFITRLDDGGEDGPAGIEVRGGELDLVADARIASGPAGLGVTLPASGWALPLEGIETRLHLPPGWDLLAVAGVDNLPNTWLARWSLLDIFLVLVITLGIGRLSGWPWGLLALLTLVITWQEPDAPRWVWLHILVAAALRRLLPAAPPRPAFRTLGTLLAVYYRGALLVLAVIALPFLITEMRDGLFPQLERPGPWAQAGTVWESTPAPDVVGATTREDSNRLEKARDALSAPAPAPAPEAEAPRRLPTLAPDALVQTGAGVPDWTWRRFDLTWNGTVAPEQRLTLLLLPPAAALALAVLRVVLVVALGLRLAGWLPAPRQAIRGAPAAAGALLLTAALLLPPGGAGMAAPPAQSAGPPTPEPAAAVAPLPDGRGRPVDGMGTDEVAAFPPQAMLDELRRRLLEPPECAPRCVEIPRLGVTVSAAELHLLLEVDAVADVALPLPGTADGWVPATLTLDGEPLTRLRRGAHGVLLAAVPAGRHRLALVGPLPAAGRSGADQVEIPLPLRPRLVEARLAEPWRLEGVDADGRPGEQLRLLREAEAPAADAPAAVADEPGALPPLLRVTRTLSFGLDWSVQTSVERLSPAATPVTLRVPLLPGEAVNTPGMQVDDGRLLVSLPPGRMQMGWASTLTPVDRLTLIAADDPRLNEVWRVEVSPVWHLSTDGVPAVRGAASGGLPTWYPWPGERLALTVSRPVGVPGPTLTLDRSRYELSPGRRGTDAVLTLALRSSQGGRHRLLLPDGAELTRVAVDGRQRSLALQDRALDLPLVPGSQRVEIAWRTPAALSTVYRPAPVELGIPGVNAETSVQLGRDRWLLWTAGPRVGPAVQFWGLLAVLAVAAAVLARSRLTPLGFASWLLLGVGLSQAGVWPAALVTLWLFALGLRRRLDAQTPPGLFDLAQLGLALLSVVALTALVIAVRQGLLGDPAMQVAGNGSTATDLNWYLDRNGPRTAAVTLVSVPVWVYRALMLAWALWLAWRLLDWLRWGWQGFSEPVLWRRVDRNSRPARGGGRDTGSGDLSVDL